RYDWGSTTAIPALLGVRPDGGPQAELWIGAHPDSPSVLPDGRSLDLAIAADGLSLLGPDVHDVFGLRLPFLTKVLAASTPLSLQVHPDQRQAAAGFAAEEAAGVARNARQRRYKDPFHKPEMVVALEAFEALCGWRDPAETRRLMAVLDVHHPLWRHLDALLDGDPPQALQRAVAWLLTAGSDVADLVRAVAAAAAGRDDRPEFSTTAELARIHPGDPGVVVALLLNRVTLARREALYLPAGNVHAYLRGTAVEVMAASDNVLRAGLTTKHVDAEELLRTVDWTPRPLPYVRPIRGGVWCHYRPAAAEFQLAWAELGEAPSDGWHDAPETGPRVVLALGAPVHVRAGGVTLELASGDAVLVGHVDGPLGLRGAGTAVVVAVPPILRSAPAAGPVVTS
ncbi:MAG TPA: mannose-6-phosphate isomerase, class I, partial [Euzebya sp.]|nr:mannose-6-phosphate isomerase, class I [Euzebya sp.]